MCRNGKSREWKIENGKWINAGNRSKMRAGKSGNEDWKVECGLKAEGEQGV
jgi:hypothetical protein